jgi:molybdenum cofactor biosynthesis enzyme MoaA
VKRGFSVVELGQIVSEFCVRGLFVRFIEYMVVGESNGWRQEHVVAKQEIVSRIAERFELKALT